MSENEKPVICPTCGSYCRVVGNITKHYVPFYSDAIKLELDKQSSEIKAQHKELERLRTANKELQEWLEITKSLCDKVRGQRDTAIDILERLK